VSPEDWAEIERLFGAAAERDAADREAFVRAQATAPDVAHEVLSLLAAHARSSVFDPLTARQDALDARPPTLEAGTRIGPWAVVHQLGAGGMGAVYLARRADGQFEHDAALKILGADMGQEIEARFVAERQVLARLSHPNIARLLDGGVSGDGRPYFVMELVEGLPIDSHCDGHRLDIAARIRLFCTVCDAVQYAHQNLVVHRDLKPSNVFVTKLGLPKLLDFGIAKLLERPDSPVAARATRPGARILTPEYASPEQLHGFAITPASDVYQLGVLLHELLVGCRPVGGFQTQSAGEQAEVPHAARRRPSQIVLGADAAGRGGDETQAARRAAARSMTPERLGRRLRGDLDDIVLKAIRIEPSRRYATAAALAEDLTRHLMRLPVRARPDTLIYRSGKFARRHAWGLAFAVGAFLLAVGFGVGMARQARRTAIERDRAEQVVEFLVGLFQSPDPALALGDTVTVRDVLDRGATRVRAELAGQPDVQATLLAVIGEVYATLGLHDSAARLVGDALASQRRAQGDAGPGIARTVRRLAMFETDAGRFESAAPLLDESLDRLRRTGRPGTEAYAGALTDIGFAWQVQGRLDLAEPLLDEALAGYEAQAAPTDGMGATLTNLGYLRLARGDADSAEALFERSVAVRRRLHGRDHPMVATSLEGLAQALVRRGALDAADSAAVEALRIRERILPKGHPLTAGLLGLRGSIRRRQGRLAEAESLFREVLGIRATLGEDHFLVAASRNDLALVLYDRGSYGEAERLFRLAWSGYRARYGTDHANTAIVELNLARLLFRTGARREAEERFAHALPIARAAFPGQRNFLSDLASLGALHCTGTAAAGLAELREAADALSPTTAEPAARNDWLWASNALGSCLARHGQADEARRVLTRSLSASAERAGTDPYRAFALRLLDSLPTRP
jgi:tetratricopeptide (TPR) repeat protein